MHNLNICGPRDWREVVPGHGIIVNTTSNSTDFGKAFSPFMNQGIIRLANLQAHNVENMWQFTKVYTIHREDKAYWRRWREKGLSDRRARRYPMGRGAKPEFSWLNSHFGRLDYINARKRIYIPAYRQKLSQYCEREVSSLIDMLSVTDVWLWDFDGYHTYDSFNAILGNIERSMGHAFILKYHILNKIGEIF